MKCKPLRIGRVIHLLSWSAVCKLKQITFDSQNFNRKCQINLVNNPRVNHGPALVVNMGCRKNTERHIAPIGFTRIRLLIISTMKCIDSFNGWR